MTRVRSPSVTTPSSAPVALAPGISTELLQTPNQTSKRCVKCPLKGLLSDPLKWLNDLQLGDLKGHFEFIWLLLFFP